MILETTAQDYTDLLNGRPPRGLVMTTTPLGSPEVLKMLADVADTVRAQWSPASWLIVEEGVLVGLCCVTRPPVAGVIDIGYGIAKDRHGCGFASRAIEDVVEWACAHPAVVGISAETGVNNIASQRVLERAGFLRTGERFDDEDGALFCWYRQTCP